MIQANAERVSLDKEEQQSAVRITVIVTCPKIVAETIHGGFVRVTSASEGADLVSQAVARWIQKAVQL